MTTATARPGRPTLERIVSALFWLAAFSFATGIFFAITLLFRNFPPTPPVAVGRVTIERASKLGDYVTALLFLLIVPPAAVWLRAVGDQVRGRFGRLFGRTGHHPWRRAQTASIVFALPYLLSPFFYLTTGKAGWILLLPILVSLTGPWLMLAFDEKRWVRALFDPHERPYHTLIILEGISWIFFRYIAAGKRIAHVPTLFLETFFVLFFIVVFWSAMVLTARLAAFTFGGSAEEALRRLSVAGLSFIALPFLAMALVQAAPAVILVACVFAAATAIALRSSVVLSAGVAHKLTVYVIVPVLLYAVSYASTASSSQWIDLFHRGESLGPASDYLRGKVPYRDVFVLHGMLEDGMLDAWLMELFGRRLDIAIARPVILGSCLAPVLWFLGMTIFDSMPLALLVVAMGSWTTAENDRTFLQIAVVALLWYALRRRKEWAATAGGVFAAVALFFSYEIGLYSIVGAFTAVAAMAMVTRQRGEWDGLPLPRAATLFGAGVVVGALPFVAFLTVRGGLGDFAQTSFVTIPTIIDAVWSLPFPDLVSTFRLDLNLHTISDFILFEKFHLVLSFLTIATALTYCIHRWVRRRLDTFDLGLMVLTIFAAVTQRTALGRAEFRHQYFSAFLIGPMLVLLVVLLLRRVRDSWLESEDGGRAFLVMAGLSGTLVVAILLWIPDLVNVRLDDVIRYQPRVQKYLHDPAAEAVLDRIGAVSAEIERVTRPGEPMFDFSNQPAFYFFANRPNPTRFYQVPILSPKRFQAETIRALERARPKLILRTAPEGFDNFDGVPNSVRAQAVAAYIDDHYLFYRTVRGVELWRRKPEWGPLNLGAYLAKIYLPSKFAINESGRARLVFPSVGSLPGVEAYWRSDLVVHNPFVEPMAVRLRYVSERKKVDRQVTIRPGQIMRWEDVVNNYFFAPGTFGVLWIEYRASRPPVCRVRTYDSLHQSNGSICDPLTLQDSANAYGDLRDLTVVGINGGGGRRVNVGVVNVGDAPASFRITVRDSRGRKGGFEIEQGLSEDSPYLLVDAEKALGVIPLNESVSLHVAMLTGSAIAYATVVDPATHEMEFIPAVPSRRP